MSATDQTSAAPEAQAPEAVQPVTAAPASPALEAVRRSRRTARPRLRTIANRPIITEGLEKSFWTDAYHNAMTVSWPAFIGALAAIFVALNLMFATVYWFGEAPIGNAHPGSFADLFFFSVETTSTVGYGDMHPQTLYGHSVATVENFVGMVLLAMMTGLVFARFSRPRARLIFAKHPVVAAHNGAPTLMVRVANARANLISEATARLWALMPSESQEGRRIIGFQPLRLVKNENPAFALSWLLYHPLEPDSPLYGMTPEDFVDNEINIVLSITGFDETSGQSIHAREVYASGIVRFDHEFTDIIRIDDEGVRHIDYARISETRPIVAPRDTAS